MVPELRVPTPHPSLVVGLPGHKLPCSWAVGHCPLGWVAWTWFAVAVLQSEQRPYPGPRPPPPPTPGPQQRTKVELNM